ncbi:hypothetical protein EG856_00755 [Mycoplasmopsis phocirhinis]|uniref:DUF31 domain-containing protein n=1 Tax=Mycoplasmopsis phocirhinis TaxID=142650 RepID=A0A4P6MQW7_9BACT|nr:hypothetical protein [Mycoplasmopsis phocirhinis]QBF34459.1 hypothetical protein EG856_00755 [Mycoplasmopsis phocirhinis]
MKKSKKWLIFTGLTLSTGLLPSLAACAKPSKPSEKNDTDDKTKINNDRQDNPNVIKPIEPDNKSQQSEQKQESQPKHISNTNNNDPIKTENNNLHTQNQDTNKQQSQNQSIVKRSEKDSIKTENIQQNTESDDENTQKDNTQTENQEQEKEEFIAQPSNELDENTITNSNITDVNLQNLDSDLIKFNTTSNDLNIATQNPNLYDSITNNYLDYFKTYAAVQDSEFSNTLSHEYQLKGQYYQSQKTDRNIGEFSLNFDNDSKLLTLNFSSDLAVNQIRIMVKSGNFLMPYAQIFQSKQSNSKKVFEFDLTSLPKHINNFIITSYSAGKYAYSLNYYPKYEFKNNNTLNDLRAGDLKIFRDQNNLYGALKLNLTQENKEYLNQKTFALTFSPVLKNANDVYKRNTLFPPRIIYVKNYDLAKFQINKLFKNVEYKLDKISVLEGDSKVESFVKINIDDVKNNVFADNLKLQNHNDNYFIQRTKLLNNQTNYQYQNDAELAQLVDSQLDTYFNFTFENSFEKYDLNYEKLNLNIIKNNNTYKLAPFLAKDYVQNTYFKIDKNNSQASLEKDLSLYEFKNLEPDKTIITFAFEFDPYQTNLRHFSEVQKARSIIKISYPLSKLMSHTKIINPHLDLTYIGANADVAKNVLNYIHKNFAFSLDIRKKANTTNTTNNINVKLQITPKANAKLFEIAAQHNDEAGESAFIGNNYLFIHHLQAQNEDVADYIKFIPKHPDALSNNSITKANKDNSYYPNIDFNLKETNPEKFATRLSKEDVTKGSQNIRSRAFSLGAGGGSWSVIGRSNNKDHRYYVMTNSHITAFIIVDELNNFINNLFEFSYFGNRRVDSLLVPSVFSKNEIKNNPQHPYYIDDNVYHYGKDEKDKINRLWFFNQTFNSDDYINAQGIENLYQFEKNKEQARQVDSVLGRIKIPIDDQISFKMIKDFHIKDEKDRNGKNINSNLHYLHGIQYDDSGNILAEKDENKNMDFSIAEIDFSFFFKYFANQKGNPTYTFEGYTLKNNEKAVVDFVLNLDNLKPLKISNEVYHYNDYSSLNWYLGSFPVNASANSASTPQSVRRYREYLITNIPQITQYRSPIAFDNYFARVFNIKQNAVDLEGGSSGTGVFDGSGDLIGVINSGSGIGPDINNNDRFITFLMFDTQKISFFGDVRNLNNPNSFVAETKKLAYLYPDLYADIYTSK